MIYSRLTDLELIHWVACTPKDHGAKAELLRRASAIVSGNDAYTQELELQVQMLQNKVDELNTELNDYVDI